MFRVAVFIFFTIQDQHGVIASFHSQLVPIEYSILCKGDVVNSGIVINNKLLKCNSTITDADALQFKQAERTHLKAIITEANQAKQKAEQAYHKAMTKAKKALRKANETLLKVSLEMQETFGKWKPPKYPNSFPFSRKNAVNLDGDVLLNGNGDLVKLRRPVGKSEIQVGQKRESDRDVRHIHISNPEALERYRQKYAEKYSDDDGVDLIKLLKLQTSVKKEREVGQKRESEREVRYIHISNPVALERYRQKYADTQESEESENLRCGCNNGRQSMQSLLDSLRSAQNGEGSPPERRCNCGGPKRGARRNRRIEGPLPSLSLLKLSGEKEKGANKMDIDFIDTKAKEADIGVWDNAPTLEKRPKMPKRQDNWDLKLKDKWDSKPNDKWDSKLLDNWDSKPKDKWDSKLLDNWDSKPKDKWDSKALDKWDSKPLDKWDSKALDKWEAPRPKRGGWGAKTSDDYSSHTGKRLSYPTLRYTTRRRQPVNSRDSESSRPRPKKPSQSNSGGGGGGGGGWGQYKNLRIEPKVYDDAPPPKRSRNRHLNIARVGYNEFGRTPIPYVGKKRIYDVSDER